MSRIGKKTLESWIKEAMSDPDKDGKLSMLVLVHMVGLQEKEIHTTKFSGGKTWTAEDLGAMFRDKANVYCQDIAGVQTFQLLAFYGTKTAPEAFMPFVVNVNGDTNGLGTEAPTEQGRLQQIMRREEMLIQQVYKRQQVMDDYTLRVIAQQAAAINDLSRENRDAFTIVKDMLMQRALDDHNRAMSQLKYERDTGERKKLMTWIPGLVNQVLGREVFPMAMADTALVEGIAESLTEDDIMKLAGVIKPEMMGPLASRMTQYMQKKASENEEMKKLSAGIRSPDPENDAAGDVVRMNAFGNGKA